MGDNSQILKLMRMMNNTPNYWILSPDTVMTGSYDDGRPLLPPGETFENKIVLTIPRDNPSILCEYICEKCSDGCYKWEYIGTWDNNLDLLDLDLDKEYDSHGHHNENLEYDNPILEFRQKVKNDDMDRDDVVRLFMKMQSQLEKYILHIDTEYESLVVKIQSFPKIDEYDKYLYQDDDGNISIIDYNDNLGYHQFTLFNLKDCDKFRSSRYSNMEVEKQRERILEFQREQQEKSTYQTYQNNKYNWMRNFNTTGLNSGSDAGHFQLDRKQAEINNHIFNNASTENIGHDKEDIDMILTNSFTSAVNCSSSISKRLKYIEMKQKKHGTITSQNITITGNYNYTVGISMNQTGGDDCEQSQTVVIKNQKSEKKKEKKESVFGVLHRALINLAKIIERYTRYLLDHCMDNFF